MSKVYCVHVELTVTCVIVLSFQLFPLGSLVINAKFTVCIPASVLSHTFTCETPEKSHVPLFGVLAISPCQPLVLAVNMMLPVPAGDCWLDMVAVPETVIQGPFDGLSEVEGSHVPLGDDEGDGLGDGESD